QWRRAYDQEGRGGAQGRRRGAESRSDRRRRHRRSTAFSFLRGPIPIFGISPEPRRGELRERAIVLSGPCRRLLIGASPATRAEESFYTGRAWSKRHFFRLSIG